jgi:hypothetical protein
VETETIDLWYKLNERIKERRHNGIFDFVAPKIISVRVSFYARNWPGMYYDELFDLVENSGNRRNYFQTFWEDKDQVDFDGYMMQQVLR